MSVERDRNVKIHNLFELITSGLDYCGEYPVDIVQLTADRQTYASNETNKLCHTDHDVLCGQSWKSQSNS